MKILLIYYTGTYNTRYLSLKVKKRFEEDGHTVDLVEINSDTKLIDTSSYTMIGFSYPIYGFNSPVPFNKYVRKLTFYKHQSYFIYKNSGETMRLNNASSRYLIRYMKKFKVTFKGEYHFILPYNIHFRFDDDFVKEILDKNNKQLEVMVYNIYHNIIHKLPTNIIYNIGATLVGVQKIGGPINSFFYKVDNSKCIKCNLCIDKCPFHNIYTDKNGNIKFHHHCNMCMRCSFYCPTSAINIGLLKGWKVNGSYHLEKIEQENKKPSKPYITKDSKGFYKCYIKTFNEIEESYAKIKEGYEAKIIK